MSKKEDIQNRMMDYLYNELEPAQREEFEKILESSPDLQKELDELRDTHTLLSSTPSVIPEYKPAFLTISNKSDENKANKVKPFFTPIMKTVLAVAASILLVLFGSSLSGMEMGQSEQGFYLTFGNPPVQQTDTGITEAQVLEIVEQMHAEQTLLLTSLLDQAQRQQNEQFNDMITRLADYYDDRREQDLIMIADGIEQLETQTYHRFNRTNAALGDLIYAISNP